MAKATDTDSAASIDKEAVHISEDTETRATKRAGICGALAFALYHLLTSNSFDFETVLVAGLMGVFGWFIASLLAGAGIIWLRRLGKREDR